MTPPTVNQEARARNVRRCRERGIVLPTFAQMREPDTAPSRVRQGLRKLGLWDVDPLNLFRITWRNEPVPSGGLFGDVNVLELPPALTGVPARILALVGKWFPTGAHKVGATYGCLARALVTGEFDSTRQKAAWPSTGNFCRGGAFTSALLGCQSIAVLPEGMSRERFQWLRGIAGEVITTPGSESNVKEIFDACHELTRTRGEEVMIFNQFAEEGNYLWHYEVTGAALLRVAEGVSRAGGRVRAFVSSTGSAGTIAAGDRLKAALPGVRVAAAEAAQCPTLLRNGFGAHGIEGIGDKHVPWIHDVRNTDVVIAVDDQDCMGLLRLFNEPEGRRLLEGRGISPALIEKLPLLGISGLANLLASIKLARWFELSEKDTVLTVLTDSMDLYGSRLAELGTSGGAFDRDAAVAAWAGALAGQRADNVLELTWPERRRVHNLKYYTWVEQQGKSVDDLNAQWQEEWWTGIQARSRHWMSRSSASTGTWGSARERLARGSPAVSVKIRYACVTCRRPVESDGIVYRCPRCAGPGQPDLPHLWPRGMLSVVWEPPYHAPLGSPADPIAMLPFRVHGAASFPVGNTPLAAAPRLAARVGLTDILFKLDFLNPSGSLKDRASFLVAEQAAALGETRVALASTGNPGASMACAGAALGLEVVLFVPASAPRAKLLQALVHGARVVPVRGSYDDAFALSIEYTRFCGGINRNTAHNPLTVEGKKTVAVEIYNQMGGRVPDLLYVPVGDGVIFSAVCKGFADLVKAGHADRVPRIAAVQVQGSNAISRGWRDGRDTVLDGTRTIADSLSVSRPAAGTMAAACLRRYGGRVVEVRDGQVSAAQAELAREAGFFVEPSAAAAWAGFLNDEERVGTRSSVVVILTGTGFKDLARAEGLVRVPPSCARHWKTPCG